MIQDGNLLGFSLGLIWGIVNIYFLSSLLKNVIQEKKTILVFFTVLIKFPLLYYVGYLLLKSELWNPLAVVAGFSSLLLLIVSQILLRFSFRNA